MATLDITQGYNAIQQGNKDENFIGKDLIELEYQRLRNNAIRESRLIGAYENARRTDPITVGTNVGHSKYDRLALNTVADYRNINEIRANNLTISDKIANGLVSFGINTGATVLDNTVGTTTGIISGLGTAAFGTGGNAFERFARGYVTNPITEIAQKARDWYTNEMPIYRSEQQPKSIGEMLVDPNFWTNDMLVNAGFTVGSMISMYNSTYGTLRPKAFRMETGSPSVLSLTSARAKINSKLNGTTFGHELTRIDKARKWKALKKLDAVSNEIETKLPRAGYDLNNVPYIGPSFTAFKASLGEARMEAYNAYSDFIKDQSNALKERRDKDIRDINNLDISEEEKQKKLDAVHKKYKDAYNSIQSNASKLAASVWALNSVILTLSNAIDENFFIRPIVKGGAGNAIIRTEAKINNLKRFGNEINELAKNKNLSYQSLLKKIDKSSPDLKKQFEKLKDLFGGEKAMNNLLREAELKATQAAKPVSEILESFTNTSAIIDNAFRGNPYQYLFGTAKTKRLALILGLIVNPTKEGWEELSQAWALENAKLYFGDNVTALYEGRSNKQDVWSLFDPAGVIGLLSNMGVGMYNATTDSHATLGGTLKSWNTVWDNNWNEGFMGYMTGLLGTVNPGGAITKRRRIKELERAHKALVELNSSLRNIPGMTEERFKELFSSLYERELDLANKLQNEKKWHVKDVWSNAVQAKLEEANEYKKNVEESAKNAEKWYAGTDETKARIRALVEGLAIDLKQTFFGNDTKYDLVKQAVSEAIIAQAAKAYELGISLDFMEQVDKIFEDIRPADEANDEDEADVIREYLKNKGLLDEQTTTAPTTEEEQLNEGEPTEPAAQRVEVKRPETIFDDIIASVSDNKIEQANNLLRNIREDIRRKQLKYEQYRNKIENNWRYGMSDQMKHMLASGMVMRDHYYDIMKEMVALNYKDQFFLESLMSLYRKYTGRNIGRIASENDVYNILDQFTRSNKFLKDMGKVNSLNERLTFYNDQIAKLGEVKDKTEELNKSLKYIQELAKQTKNELDNIFELNELEYYEGTKQDDFLQYHRFLKGELEEDEELSGKAKKLRDDEAESIFDDNGQLKPWFRIDTKEGEGKEKVFLASSKLEGIMRGFDGNINNLKLSDTFENSIELLLTTATKADKLREAIVRIMDDPDIYETKYKEIIGRYNEYMQEKQTDDLLKDIDVEDYRLVFDLLHNLNLKIESIDNNGLKVDYNEDEHLMQIKTNIMRRLSKDPNLTTMMNNLLDLEDTIDFVNETFKGDENNEIKLLILGEIERGLQINVLDKDSKNAPISTYLVETDNEGELEIINKIKKIDEELWKKGVQTIKPSMTAELRTEAKKINRYIENVNNFESFIISLNAKTKERNDGKKNGLEEGGEIKKNETNIEASHLSTKWKKHDIKIIGEVKEEEEDGAVIIEGGTPGGGETTDPGSGLNKEEDLDEKDAEAVQLLIDNNTYPQESIEMEGDGNTAGLHSITDKSIIESSVEKSTTRSYQTPAYDTDSLSGEKTEDGSRTLVENDTVTAKIARYLYLSSVDKGVVIQLEERLQEHDEDKSDDKKIEGIVLIRPNMKEVDNTKPEWRERIIENTGIKYDELSIGEKMQLNSIVYMAMEIGDINIDDLRARGIIYNLQIIEHDGKTYVIVGMLNTEGDKNISQHIAKQIEDRNNERGTGPIVKFGILKDNNGKAVRLKIGTIYSGRIANRIGNEERLMRTVSLGMFPQGCLIISYVEDAAAGMIRYTPYGTMSIQDYDDSIFEDTKGNGAVYVLAKAPNGRIYRIAAQVPRFDNSQYDLVPGTVLELLGNEFAAIAEAIKTDLDGKPNTSISAAIDLHRKNIARLLCLVVLRKENGNAKVYRLLIVSRQDDGIHVAFKLGAQIYEGIIIKKGTAQEDIAKQIEELYKELGFRVALPAKEGSREQSTQDLIELGYIISDIVDNNGTIFNDSSFECDTIIGKGPESGGLTSLDIEENKSPHQLTRKENRARKPKKVLLFRDTQIVTTQGKTSVFYRIVKNKNNKLEHDIGISVFDDGGIMISTIDEDGNHLSYNITRYEKNFAYSALAYMQHEDSYVDGVVYKYQNVGTAFYVVNVGGEIHVELHVENGKKGELLKRFENTTFVTITDKELKEFLDNLKDELEKAREINKITRDYVDKIDKAITIEELDGIFSEYNRAISDIDDTHNEIIEAKKCGRLDISHKIDYKKIELNNNNKEELREEAEKMIGILNQFINENDIEDAGEFGRVIKLVLEKAADVDTVVLGEKKKCIESIFEKAKQIFGVLDSADNFFTGNKEDDKVLFDNLTITSVFVSYIQTKVSEINILEEDVEVKFTGNDISEDLQTMFNRLSCNNA